jgi:hypothetical protein
MATVLSLILDTSVVIRNERSHVWFIHVTWSSHALERCEKIETVRNCKLQWKQIRCTVSVPLSVVSKSGAWEWFERDNIERKLSCVSYCMRNKLRQFNNVLAHGPKTQHGMRRPRWKDNIKKACYRNHICRTD